jgi:hypothetical protein
MMIPGSGRRGDLAGSLPATISQCEPEFAESLDKLPRPTGRGERSPIPKRARAEANQLSTINRQSSAISCLSLGVAIVSGKIH